MSDTTEKQGIINLSSYSSRSYATIVFTDSEVAFLGGWGKDAASHPFLLLCFVYTQRCRIEEGHRQILSSTVFQDVFRRGL